MTPGKGKPVRENQCLPEATAAAARARGGLRPCGGAAKAAGG